MESFLGRAWRKQRQAAAAAERKSSGLADVLADERLEDGENLFLLTARQFGGGGKELPHLPGRAGTALLAFAIGKQCLNGKVQRRCQALQLFRAQGHGAALPMGVSALRHAELVGNLLLREPHLLAQRMQPFTEGRAAAFGWSAGLHAENIFGLRESLNFCLHSMNQ